MNFNFEVIFLYALIVCGFIALVDLVFLTPRRKKVSASTNQPHSNELKRHIIFEYAREFFPILLLIFFLRSFLFEAFRIPSGSLKPTLLIGDLILVNKFDYGIRLPVLHKKIWSINSPQHGDIVVFREPPTETRDLIKRVVGVPGDHISYIHKILYVNGQKMPQEFQKFSMDHDDNLTPWQVEQKQENFFGVKHGIYQIPDKEQDDLNDFVVPPGKYFMMGDNRDDSADSRTWGFLPEENIVGKAIRVLLSWDTIKHPFRWARTGMKIT